MQLSRAVAIALLVLTSGPTVAGTGYGEVVFQNRTSWAGSLYYDENYACYAQGGLECHAMARLGRYRFTARYSNALADCGMLDVYEGKITTCLVTE